MQMPSMQRGQPRKIAGVLSGQYVDQLEIKGPFWAHGHKRVHALKFQSVVAPNGLIANLFGPVKGHRHDSGMLAISGL